MTPPEHAPLSGVQITITQYHETLFQEKTPHTVEECSPAEEPTTTWIHVEGLSEGTTREIGTLFGIHPLTVEDILNTEQRPKMEDFSDYVYLTLKMIDYDEEEQKTVREHVSIVLGSNYVISFQEGKKDIFSVVRGKLKNEKSQIRRMGADYLVYALLDAIVDHYYDVLERLGELIEEREEELLESPTMVTLGNIQALKREMMGIRKSVWPLREVLNSLEADSPLIERGTGVYVRDVYDRTVDVVDTVETYRDMLSEMVDIYLSSLSNKMNEIMKVLTIIATIFIPLTFIVGIYGMNFKIMPELEWWFGYPMVMAIMGAVGGLMLFYFRKKKWM